MGAATLAVEKTAEEVGAVQAKVAQAEAAADRLHTFSTNASARTAQRASAAPSSAPCAPALGAVRLALRPSCATITHPRASPLRLAAATAGAGGLLLASGSTSSAHTASART